MWDAFFYTYIAILAALFLALGIISTMLLIKRDCVRLQTKLFFIIYTCIAILGYSKATWLVLDPFGLVGFIQDAFSEWFVVSRLIDAAGFPSLVASYTLMIATLLKISTKPGHQWYHEWKMTTPLLVAPFLVVYTAEIVALIVPYPGLISVVICELVFMVWGIVVCLLFLYAGNRLLRKVRRRQLRSMRVSDAQLKGTNQSDIAARSQYVTSEQQRHQNQFRKTSRKITLITYATVFFTFTYSLVTTGRAVLICFVLFDSCLGYQDQRGSSAAWLVLEISQRVIEVLLALVLLYSITDITLVRKLLRCPRLSNNIV